MENNKGLPTIQTIESMKDKEPSVPLESPLPFEQEFNYQNWLEKKNKIGDEVTRFINEHSQEIIDGANLAVKGGYSVAKIEYPKKEDMMYNGRLITEQLNEVFDKNLDDKNLKSLESSMKGLGKYVESFVIIDNGCDKKTDDQKCDIVETYFKDNNKPEFYDFYYEHNKLRGTPMSNPLKVIMYNDVFGVEPTDEMKKIYDELLPLFSSDSKYVNYNNYRELSEDKRVMASELATQLSKAICIQFIEKHKNAV